MHSLKHWTLNIVADAVIYVSSYKTDGATCLQYVTVAEVKLETEL